MGSSTKIVRGRVNCIGFNQSECFYVAMDGTEWGLQEDGSGGYAKDANGNYIVAGKPAKDEDGNLIFDENGLVFAYPDGLPDGRFIPVSGPGGEPITIRKIIKDLLSSADTDQESDGTRGSVILAAGPRHCRLASPNRLV